MSKSNLGGGILIGVLSVLVGFLAFAFTGSIFDLAFVAIIVIVLYDYSNKLNEIQKRLSELESRAK